MTAAVVHDWRRDLRRKIAALLLVKLMALIALKSFFFSAEQRVHVNGAVLGDRLALQATAVNKPESPSREVMHD